MISRIASAEEAAYDDGHVLAGRQAVEEVPLIREKGEGVREKSLFTGAWSEVLPFPFCLLP
jgi:hypothetical protein